LSSASCVEGLHAAARGDALPALVTTSWIDRASRSSWIVTLKAAVSVLLANKKDTSLLENFPAVTAN
jgi:hypothetical protein